MDDTLKRRMVGAAVLLLLALLLSLLLPGPGHAPGEGGQPVVAYDLRTGAPLNLPLAQPPPPPVKLKPVAISSSETPAAETPASEAPALGGAKPIQLPRPEVTTEATPEPVPSSAQGARSEGPRAGRPALKVDESFGAGGSAAWYVQVGSFERKDNARAQQMKLAKLGLPAILQGITVDKKLWYRVRVGPYTTEAPAQQALTTVRAHGYAAAKVARPDAGAN